MLGDRWLRLAYQSPMRSVFRALLFRRLWASRLLGWYCDSRWSRGKIGKAIQELGIDEGEFDGSVDSFRSFNDFFSRRLRQGCRPFEADPGVLCSPADCRMLLFPALNGDECVPVKGRPFNVAGLLADPVGAAGAFRGGSVVVARLCPADYHRFHYPADGTVLRTWSVSGRADSVNPIALSLGLPVFTENVRHVSLLDLEQFGTAAFVEVGAFGVARIVRTHQGRAFRKMDERGYFAFGGSTVVMVLGAGQLQPAEDLVANTAAGHETLVRVGETIGHARGGAGHDLGHGA